MRMCKFSSCVSLPHLQRRLIEECDELSSQEHNHLFSQELYRDKETVRDRRTSRCIHRYREPNGLLVKAFVVRSARSMQLAKGSEVRAKR